MPINKGYGKPADVFTHYVNLNGTTNYLTTPDSTANSVVGSLDIRVKAAADDWTPPLADDWIAFVSKWNTVGGQGGFEFCHRSTGRLYLAISQNGTGYNDFTSASAVSFANGEAGWVRATFNASTSVVSLYESSNYNPYNELGSWTLLGSGNIVLTGIFNSSYGIDIGRVFWSGASADLFKGKIYYAEVRNGIDGPIVAKFNASTTTNNGTTFPNIPSEIEWTNNGGIYVPA